MLAQTCCKESKLEQLVIPTLQQYQHHSSYQAPSYCEHIFVQVSREPAECQNRRYYILFARLYSNCLKSADSIMVNSSWTQVHVNGLLGQPDAASKDTKRDNHSQSPSGKYAHIVYPPCDTKSLQGLPLEGRENIILSLAQFR